jgi:cytochrome o ubiquinol oxidase subunit 3
MSEAERSDHAPRTALTGGVVFVLSDAVTFAALLTGAMMLRFAGRDWPSAHASTPQLLGLTALLFGGSAVIAIGKRRPRLLGLAAALGLAFVGGEIIEWRALLQAHEGPSADLRHASLFVVTGLHGLHVTIGALALLWYGMKRGSKTAVRILSYYWLALDVAWVGIVAGLYL